MEISKKVYIKGEDALIRLKNLEKLAREHYHGNFSEMVNECLNKCFNLEPATGQPKAKAKA